MSLFKKPNRNIRRREVDSDDESNSDSDSAVGITKVKLKNGNSSTKSSNVNVKQTLLSFGKELEEGEDGEVFTVKKTSYSKKIRKQMEKEKEREKKKETKSENEIATKKSNPLGDARPDTIIETEDNLVIRIKNPIAGPVCSNAPGTILSGRSAEMAGYRSGSDSSERDEEEEGGASPSGRHQFSRPNSVKQLLKSGRIPDASLIHAARKKRQQAREMNEVLDFIPVNNASSSTGENGLSCAVNEEYDGLSDEEEEVITMAGIVTNKEDKQNRRQGLSRSVQSPPSSEEEDDEDRDWEEQQIRKAVTATQLAVAHQESLMTHFKQPPPPPPPSITPPPTLAPTFNSAFDRMNLESQEANVFPPLPSCKPQNEEDGFQIATKLRAWLTSLQDVNAKRDSRLKDLQSEISEISEEMERRKKEQPDLEKRYQFYQDLRGYVTDLVECLDEKIPIIDALEQRVLKMYRDKADKLAKRRRQDTSDQMDELSKKQAASASEREERVRRKAEREGRKMRRMKIRQLEEASKHTDGMSSDDELDDMADIKYKNDKNSFAKHAELIFEDVHEEFTSISCILNRYEQWKRVHIASYNDAYANICLPKLLAPILRTNCLLWNPLTNEDDVILEHMEWVKCVMLHSTSTTDTELQLRLDPDVNLVPMLFEKVIVPKLEQLIDSRWDPLSRNQSRRLECVLSQLVAYPTINAKSKPFAQLMDTLVKKMKNAIEHDVFIPLLPKNAADAGQLNVFFQRQFTLCVKLLGNLSYFEKLVNRQLMVNMCVNSLLNRYILMAIRTLQPLEAATKTKMILNSLPQNWISGGEMPQELKQFISHVRDIVQQLHAQQNDPHATEAKMWLIQKLLTK